MFTQTELNLMRLRTLIRECEDELWATLDYDEGDFWWGELINNLSDLELELNRAVEKHAPYLKNTKANTNRRKIGGIWVD